MTEKEKIKDCMSKSLEKDVRIRTSPEEIVRGRIIDVKLKCWRDTKMLRHAQFKVILVCGEHGMKRSFILEKLPNGEVEDPEIKAVGYEEPVPF